MTDQTASAAPDAAANPSAAVNSSAAAGAQPAVSSFPAGDNPGGADGASSIAAGAAPAFYRPKDLPEHLAGKSDQETIDNLFKAYAGTRADISKYGEVPKDPTGYSYQPDEKVKAYLTGDNDNELVRQVQGIFHQHGLRDKQAQGVLNGMMTWLVDMEVVEPAVDIAAERKALIPQDAAGLPEADALKIADKRIQDNLTFVGTLTNHGLPQDAVAALQTLGDTRQGHAVYEFIKGLIPDNGIRPGGTGGTVEGEAQLKARVADPRHNSLSPSYDPAFRAETDRLYKAFYGEGPRA
jgi:hypothetical protein